MSEPRYDLRSERDACGIGFVANAEGTSSRLIVEKALDALCALRHRGAVAADERSGDGAGLLVPLPVSFLEQLAGGDQDPGFLGLAMTFSWHGDDKHRSIVETACSREGIDVVAWREVPIDPGVLGEAAALSTPSIEQAILLRPIGVDKAEAERRCIRARKHAEKDCIDAGLRVYFPSFSFLTVTYKALCVADQLSSFYLDLGQRSFTAPFAIFHQRFSTNTLPTWERAQPFRTLCHNGEINTIQGNINRMRAREGRLGKRNLLEEELLRPVIDESGSDSAMLDNVVELLSTEGRDIAHVMAMLVPAAWENAEIEDEVRDFYRYHSCIVEAWDGPAGLIFTDGTKVGATLDRNGLRPLRYSVSESGIVACSSEAGSVDLSGQGRVSRRKLGPGGMIVVDASNGGLNEDPIQTLAQAKPYGEWTDTYLQASPLPDPDPKIPDDILQLQVAFGYTKEMFTTVIRPMATSGHEPTSSMGDDTASAILSDHLRPLYNYFKQRFAQVTNPPIDPVRERAVMSMRTLIGPHDPILWERPEAASLIELDTFFLFKPLGGYPIDATFPVGAGARGLAAAIESIADEADQAARIGSGILVLSDAAVNEERAPVPMLLAVGAVHQRLLRAGHRTRTSIVVETDEAREVHEFACLLGYGAEAICPRLALASIADLTQRGRLGEDIPVHEALMRYRSAVEEGVLKILSKMGISTTDSYRGAQIFDAVGLAQELIDLCFTGTHSPFGGIGVEEIAQDVLRRHFAAYSVQSKMENPGYLKHHSKGEYHETNPGVVDALHSAVRNGSWDDYARFAALVEDRPVSEPRDLLQFAQTDPIPLDEVEPAEAILRRFSSGAISHGAIGAEAHETLARALNAIGGRANSGEGGEDPARFRDDRNCKIKQVASGRFGVTPEYLAFAEELQIKMAQGSKPGEGGQLPGHKVTAEIARLRHTQPGVALISPPPHHDIYSIEDLAQLIFDLKQANPSAAVSVKLVSEAGVGTIAAGVAKALADVVHISGWDGGTGASPLSSIKNAGLPWEFGVAEAQRTLVENGLRSRVRLRVDGGMKSGRDVLMAALLGADEFSFGTSVLLAEGCIMVRACHRDTCPVGIATQRPELREKFAGTPEMVANYLRFVAQDVRKHLARLGLRSLSEAIGRTDLLTQRSDLQGRAALLRLDPLLSMMDGPRHFRQSLPIQQPRSGLGDWLYEEAAQIIEGDVFLELEHHIGTADRAVGARLGAAIARVHGASGPAGRVTLKLTGAAGQSFGAFLSSGVELRLIGEANDYVGKGMGGGRIVITAPPDDAGDPYLAGNTILYGATGGELYIAGRVGERFGVRNSGARAVVEGVGGHAAEYMTGGTIVILGPTGWNLGAGMTGGEVFVWDPQMRLPPRVNPELVDMHHPGDEHLATLLEALADHAELTGSVRAIQLLDGGPEPQAFWRIAPKAEVARIEGRNEGSVEAQR